MFSKLLNGIFGAAGVGLCVQFPAFYQQYLQRLGGHLEQATSDVGRFRDVAISQGQTFEQYLSALSSTDNATAQAVRAAAGDQETFTAAFQSLGSAKSYEQPLAFAQHFNGKIAQDTMNIFEPSLPLTMAGLLYALVGVLLGVLVFMALAGIGRAIFRSWRYARSAAKMQRRRPMDGLENTSANPAA